MTSTTLPCAACMTHAERHAQCSKTASNMLCLTLTSDRLVSHGLWLRRAAAGVLHIVTSVYCSALQSLQAL